MKKEKVVSHVDQEEVYIRSRLECFYMMLDQLKQEQIQKDLDIDFWKKRIVKTFNQTESRKLEIELNQYKEEKKNLDDKIRIIDIMIQDEKKSLSQDDLTKQLERVKIRSSEDIVKRLINSFQMSIVSYEIDYKFWKSRLIDQTQPEVKATIEVTVLPELKKSIENNNGGKKNAEIYLNTLQEQKKKGDSILRN